MTIKFSKMLRSYKDYRNIRPLRRNRYGDINLVSDRQGAYFILSTQIVPKDNPGWVDRKQQLYKRLKHPNVDQAIDVFVAENDTLSELVVVTQMCQNTSLDAFLGGLSELQVKLAMLDLTQGLCYLHNEAQVLHRNIRTQSVLVNGSSFLISDYTDAEILSAGGTMEGLAGKKTSMSPEMLSAEPYSFPSDVWTLGVLFVQLLLRTPFRNVETKLAALQPDFPESIMARIPHDWARELLRGMFKKTPSERFTMKEVQIRLRNAFGDPWKDEKHLEVKQLSETSRLLVDRNRHLFVEKSFPVESPEEREVEAVKRLMKATHANIVRVEAVRMQQDECKITVEYCRSGSLLFLFKQMHENEVMDTIRGLWQGFRYLYDRNLLLAAHLSLQLVLVSKARPKIQLLTEKTFGSKAHLTLSDSLAALSALFVSLLKREQFSVVQLRQLLTRNAWPELKDSELNQVLVAMVHPDPKEHWSITRIDELLNSFLDAKQQQEAIMVYRNYRVVREIARGVLGTVCLAESEKKEYFAVKIIPCRLPTDYSDVRNEAENLMKAVHPNIVELHEYFSNDSNTEMILVMERCDERTLKDLLDELDPAQKMQVTKELCEVVHYMHVQLRMIHRDIKPVNILMKNGHVKLADFGRSKVLGPNQKLTAAVGCEEYMPPEMGLSQEYSFSVDVWNLGIVLLDVHLGRLVYPNSIAYMDAAFPENLLMEVADTPLCQLLSGMIQRRIADRLTIEQVVKLVRKLN